MAVVRHVALVRQTKHTHAIKRRRKTVAPKYLTEILGSCAQ
jgi:hypothetical protein